MNRLEDKNKKSKWVIGVLGLSVFLFLITAVFPAASHAQKKLRIQSAFPAKGTFNDTLVYFAERVKALSGGRLEIEIFQAGSIVPAFDVLDAVHKGILEGAHSSPAYYVGKNRAAALFGTSPSPFGMDTFDYIGWIYEGGGMELTREFYQQLMKQNLVSFPLTSAGPQALGWFKRELKGWADLKGLKCRETGISAEVFSKSGMVTVNMPGGEILAAGERGVIDCAEWVGPSDDTIIGFHTVWKHFYTQSYHDLSVLELVINGDVWKSLSPDLQAIIQSATLEATLRSFYHRNRLDAAALKDMTTKDGVIVHATPEDILKKSLESWDEIAKEEAAKNPFFSKVYESQRAYASQVVTARRIASPPYNFAADHYFPVKK